MEPRVAVQHPIEHSAIPMTESDLSHVSVAPRRENASLCVSKSPAGLGGVHAKLISGDARDEDWIG